MFHKRNLFVSITAGLAMLIAACGDPGQRGSGEVGTSQAKVVEACFPTGAHDAHVTNAGIACTACHVCNGGFGFDPAGPAVGPVGSGFDSPTFDRDQKTCSNVLCHSVPAGTFGYYFPGGDGEPVYMEVSYGGAGSTTPSWYAGSEPGSTGCTGCHGNPPAGNNTWHSGAHAFWTIADGNSCTLCHPHVLSQLVDADPNTPGIQPTSTRAYVATGISTASTCGPLRNEPCAPRHRNGALTVEPRWTSRCFGCH